MDFASESVRDAFPLQPTRSAQASAAPSDDNGRSFDDHLDAVNEPPLERTPAPHSEARDECAPPTALRDAQADETEPSAEDVDADAVLLGGPLPPAPPPMAAPIAVQLAISQPAQPSQAPSQSEGADAPIAPLSTTQAPPPNDAEMADAADPAAPSEPTADKNPDLAAKDTAPKATTTGDNATQMTTPQTQAVIDTLAVALRQSADAPTPISELPQPVQQAIAATLAATPQTSAQTATRSNTSEEKSPEVEEKSAPNERDGKPEAPISNAKAQANAAPSADSAKVVVDATPAPLTQSAAPDTSQLAESSANMATTSQANTHVQQTAAETGAQRAAPATAQVAREIIRRFNGGTTNFELRLDPADLGRVEVRMEVTRDHRVTAVITADNPQALTELARGARDLEQQLQSAGLQLSDNGLSFDLRQGAQDGGDAENANANNRGGRGDNAAVSEQQAAPVARPIGYERWRGVRVDMMV